MIVVDIQSGFGWAHVELQRDGLDSWGHENYREIDVHQGEKSDTWFVFMVGERGGMRYTRSAEFKFREFAAECANDWMAL